VHIQNIRCKRTTTGIKAQQLSGLEFVAEISNGVIHGGHVGSTEIFLQTGNSSEHLATEFVIYQKLGYGK
jgi:RNA 3'-terminal phosphate cyclase